MKLFVLDSSALINSPNLDFNGLMISVGRALKELKSIEVKQLALNAIKQGKLKIIEPTTENIKKVEEKIKEKGFKGKLSKTDKEIIALALQLKKERKKIEVITDDYSIQNFLKIFKIKFTGIIQGKIKKVLEFKLYCPACKKNFLHNYKSNTCDFCGSILKKQPVFS